MSPFVVVHTSTLCPSLEYLIIIPPQALVSSSG
ncbi:uncharacterized protein METZ01_LOCUS274130 [marine metagenome]|uniref:Uncharacterized protein n=1 Tax=marine metagenome TaxID=408172 RepID=A0A382KBA7_9ZZZZ